MEYSDVLRQVRCRLVRCLGGSLDATQAQTLVGSNPTSSAKAFYLFSSFSAGKKGAASHSPTPLLAPFR